MAALEVLMRANLHLGHSAEHLHPRMLAHVYGQRDDINIINLNHTQAHLRRACAAVRQTALLGIYCFYTGNNEFNNPGTKPMLHRITMDAAIKANQFFITHWIGGTFSNRARVLRRSVGYDPDRMAKALVPLGDDNRGRSNRKRKGKGKSSDEDDGEMSELRELKNKQPFVHKPDLLIVLDYPNCLWAVREANAEQVPVIAICDTDCDPSKVQFSIPANDDSQGGVQLIAGILAMASAEGCKAREVLEAAAAAASATESKV